MKKHLYISMIVVLLLALTPLSVFAADADEPLTVDLLAGQTNDIGDVKVWNDADNLYIQLISTQCMIETHVHVATSFDLIPQKNGNPIPGKFEYTKYHGCSMDYTYTIPLTWAYDTNLYIAVHAALGQEEVMVIYSDGNLNTMVTAGNVTDAVYPYAAVDAWEISGDPTDPTPSTWDNRLTYKDWAMADWVWESYRTVDPKVTQYVSFEHAFNVPGYPMGGKLHIATDNTYNASLNSAFVGEQTNYNNWYQVGAYDIFPVEGANVLQVIGSNYGSSSYTIDSNPAGLIYEAEITYIQSGESAWAAGYEFPGKNWATYFTYTVTEQLPELVETLTVSSDGTTVCTSAPLTSGENYQLKASGTFTYIGSVWADAEWYLLNGVIVKGDTEGSKPYVLDISIDGYSVNVDWGDYNPEHIYYHEMVGAGDPVCFSIYDSYSGDNNGALTVEVWLLP